MIIKSHIRGGYRAAADYLKSVGQNEQIRLVEISDPDASNLDEAFQNMWGIARKTRCTKPLHHISINPLKDERLTDAQVQKIVGRCEMKYGYQSGNHQRVIVEHIKDGRQHYHVIWNRVSLTTCKPVWPGHHWNKSKQAAREMETELGLKRPMPKRVKRIWANIQNSGRASRYFGRYQTLTLAPLKIRRSPTRPANKLTGRPPASTASHRPIRPTPIPAYSRRTRDENIPDSEKLIFRRP